MNIKYWEKKFGCIECSNKLRPVYSSYSSLDSAVEDVARDYHDHHDGCNETWPKVFTIVLLNKYENIIDIGDFEVERCVTPTFITRKLESY